jgi:hypothetical protein
MTQDCKSSQYMPLDNIAAASLSSTSSALLASNTMNRKSKYDESNKYYDLQNNIQLASFNNQQYKNDFLIKSCDGNTSIAAVNTTGVDYFFNQESPYKFPPMIICDDAKRLNANDDILQKYSDVIYDECGNRFNIRNMRDSAGLLQAGYSKNIDLDSHMKNINFYNDKCYYDNWKMEPKIQDVCTGLKRNEKVLVPDYTPVGRHYEDTIGNCAKGAPCNNTPPSDINCEVDVRKRYDFSHNKFKTESCIKPADRVSFKRAIVEDVSNLYKFPNEQRNLELLNSTLNKGLKTNDKTNQTVQHEYYKFFEDTKCVGFPEQRLFNNITKAKCLPSHHFKGDIGPKYFK